MLYSHKKSVFLSQSTLSGSHSIATVSSIYDLSGLSSMANVASADESNYWVTVH